MRFRKVAALAAGALTMGLVAAPGLTSTAVAAADGITSTADLRCTYSSYGTNYTGSVTTTVAPDGAVSMTAENIPGFGMPAFLMISKITSTVSAQINGETVSLSGTDTYSPSRAGNLDLPVPVSTGTRTGTDPVTSVAITSLNLGMTVSAYGQTIPATLKCLPAVHTTTTLTATSSAPNAVDLAAAVTPASATGTVEFYEGATKVGSGAVADGAVSTALSGVAMGEHTYTAKYLPTNGSAFTPSQTGSSTAAVSATNVTAADLRCTYSSYGTNYTGSVTTTVAPDGAVSMTAENIPGFGMPAFLMISKITSTVSAQINGETVSLSGTDTYSPSRAGNLDLPVPVSTGTRTGTDPVTSVAITSLNLGMTVSAYGQTIPATLKCLPAVHTTTTLTATSSAPNAVDLAAAVTPASATGTVEFYEGATKVGSGAVADGAVSTALSGVAMGEHTYTAKYLPTNGSAFTPSETAAGVSVTVGDPEPEPEPVDTTTTLAATSGAANAVSLSASVTPAEAAGTVEFFEGDTKVGEQDVVSGAAALELTGVEAGEHSYTATFVPADEDAFNGSTSTAAVVTVAEDTTCTDAEAELAAANEALTSAQAKATSAKTAVTTAKTAKAKADKAVAKAKKAVTKAKTKGAKAKAKRQLAQAKKAVAKAKKAVTSAKAKAAAATAKVVAAQELVDAAQEKVNTSC